MFQKVRPFYFINYFCLYIRSSLTFWYDCLYILWNWRRQVVRQKRRVTRAVRPTKRIEFTEADGQPEGKIAFQLEKESEHETFKIRDENPWVTVEPNGSVRVKKRWDYEELGREKTIDFWVIITNSGAAGKGLASFSL